jgi:hypothetical protein
MDLLDRAFPLVALSVIDDVTRSPVRAPESERDTQLVGAF